MKKRSRINLSGLELPRGERLRFAILSARPVDRKTARQLFERYFAFSVLMPEEVPVVNLLPRARSRLTPGIVKKNWPEARRKLDAVEPHAVLLCGAEVFWAMVSLKQVLPDFLTDEFEREVRLRGGGLSRSGGAFRAVLGKTFQTRRWRPGTVLIPVLDPAQAARLKSRTGPDQSAAVRINRFQSFPGQFFPIRYYRKFRTFRTEHYTIHYPASNAAAGNIRKLAKAKENQFDWLLAELELSRPRFRLAYFLFNSPRDARQMTGFAWEGRCSVHRREIYRVHTKEFPGFTSPHEDIHALEARETYASFIAEGMAQHLSSKWFDYTDYGWIGKFAGKYHVPSLRQLLDLEFFLSARRYPDQASIMYNLAEHFMGFFLERYGMRAYHVLMSAGTKSELFSEIRRETGRTVDALNRQWRRSFRR